MKYTNYKAEEFCEDADFIQWILNPTDETNRFWAAFLTDNPDQQKEVQLAKEYIKTLRFQEIEPSKEEMAALKQRIWQDIETPPSVFDVGGHVRPTGRRQRASFWSLLRGYFGGINNRL